MQVMRGYSRAMARFSRAPAWFAILAIAVQASWPLLAQARPRALNALDSVCSAEKGAPSGHHESPTPDHCKLCATSFERPLSAVVSPFFALFDAARTHEAVYSDVALAGLRCTAISGSPRAPPVS